MVNDFAWMLAALTKPILDEETGKEVEPAKILKDDLQKWIDTHVKDGRRIGTTEQEDKAGSEAESVASPLNRNPPCKTL